jgi:hypothetical protein
MQTNIHLNHGGRAVAEPRDTYTSVDLYERGHESDLDDKVVVFVDLESAKALAIAALTALFALNSEAGGSYVALRDHVLLEAASQVAPIGVR